MEIEWIWTIASFITGCAIFYFAHELKSHNKKTWVALFAGLLLSMGLISALFLTGHMCKECGKYCRVRSCNLSDNP